MKNMRILLYGFVLGLLALSFAVPAKAFEFKGGDVIIVESGEVIEDDLYVGAATVGLKLGKRTFYKYIDALGFGKLSNIDLPGETEGLLIPGKHWKPINLATISYGQGIAVTPIQMVQAYGAIVNEGVMLKPRLVRKIIDNQTGEVKIIKPRIIMNIFFI